MRITNSTTNIHRNDIIPTTRSTLKRPRNMSNQQSLLPGLPDHIAQLCLSLVPPSTLSSVSHSWRRLIYSPPFPPFLVIHATLLPTQTSPTPSSSSTYVNNAFTFASFDPISSQWLPLPPLPPLNILLRHPSFISRNLPLQSVTVSDNLILLAATEDRFLPALARPLIFSPFSGTWSFGPELSTPRRWCAAGSSDGVVYVASGFGSRYSPKVARSVEKWNLNNRAKIFSDEMTRTNDVLVRSEVYLSTDYTLSVSNGQTNNGSSKCKISNEKSLDNRETWKWERMREMRDAKFSREAIDGVGWRGKLCMVNVKGDTAKEGIIYDVRNDVWEEMPEGMRRGWRGPAAAMDEEIIFVVDENKGVLKKYDPEMDRWDLVFENEMMKGAQSVAVRGGRACVVCGGGRFIFVVDVAAEAVTPRFWVVETPQGFEALDVHILPRMSR